MGLFIVGLVVGVGERLCEFVGVGEEVGLFVGVLVGVGVGVVV